MLPSSGMEDQLSDSPKAPAEPRGLSVRLDLLDAAELRTIAAETDSKVRDVLAVLAYGCSLAIRSGSLKRSIVQRKMQALQALAGPPAQPVYYPPSPPPEVEVPRVGSIRIPSLSPQIGPSEPLPAGDPLSARRSYE